ncbi:hypothetical protein DNTS_009454 [Danionella cerebrum]|uniref:Uncharacterized protein n=1 Tax=Danionella cerebrum TaxID=2873325 RepID=A0A553PWS8_9TELE|nr:hypothetical protein DNTS_009454 [Danionella translucida]
MHSPEPTLLAPPPDSLSDRFPPDYGWMTPGRRSPLPVRVVRKDRLLFDSLTILANHPGLNETLSEHFLPLTHCWWRDGCVFATDGSYIDVSHRDSHTSSPLDSSFESEDPQALYWHEDSKPGTIV